ncbi:MAG: sigma-54 dependent transcriptional regulator [Planctomycetota bacterium]
MLGALGGGTGIGGQWQSLAASDVTVLIGGETGSGKGAFARSIHAESRRSAAPFVVADCSALPASLFESQMFGHAKGAFTGASSERLGLVRAASGGTLFLDEVGELAPELQAKLLTLLEDRTVLPVGCERRVSVDVRFIAATHRSLQSMVQEGTFREDLYYRLAVVELDIPPLRERQDELPGLIDALIDRKARLLHVQSRPASPEFVAALRAYDWPGNIRELGNCIERALVLATGETLDIDALPYRVRNAGQSPTARTSIDDAIKEAGGNKAAAARTLGISRRHLYRLLNERASN